MFVCVILMCLFKLITHDTVSALGYIEIVHQCQGYVIWALARGRGCNLINSYLAP